MQRFAATGTLKLTILIEYAGPNLPHCGFSALGPQAVWVLHFPRVLNGQGQYNEKACIGVGVGGGRREPGRLLCWQGTGSGHHKGLTITILREDKGHRKRCPFSFPNADREASATEPHGRGEGR
jgi:hypothetical protein